MNKGNDKNNIELIVLDPLTTLNDIEESCKAVLMQGIGTICVPPVFVKTAKSILAGKPVKVSTVAGYPVGFNAIEAKVAEIVLAILDGVDEINVTINITALKNKDWQYLASELNAILPVIRSKNKEVIIDIQANLLSAEELRNCCDLYGIAGVNMLQLSSSPMPAEEQLELLSGIRLSLADPVGIKVVTHVENSDIVKLLLSKGAARIGVPDLSYLASSKME